MLDNFLRSLPRWFIVSVSLVGGLLFLLVVDPPHTVCTSQLEIFRADASGLLFSKSKNGTKTKPLLPKLVSRCKSANSPGGCFEFFHAMRAVLKGLQQLPGECTSEVSSISAVKRAIKEAPELMILLAWGHQPPRSYLEKQGWLESSEMALFCDLKEVNVRFYGKEPWRELQERLFTDLPGAANMVRGQVWERLLLSSRCERWK